MNCEWICPVWKCRRVPIFQITTPYYDTLFSVGKNGDAVQAFHAGLRLFESELKDRGGVYFGDNVSSVNNNRVAAAFLMCEIGYMKYRSFNCVRKM